MYSFILSHLLNMFQWIKIKYKCTILDGLWKNVCWCGKPEVKNPLHQKSIVIVLIARGSSQFPLVSCTDCPKIVAQWSYSFRKCDGFKNKLYLSPAANRFNKVQLLLWRPKISTSVCVAPFTFALQLGEQLASVCRRVFHFNLNYSPQYASGK